MAQYRVVDKTTFTEIGKWTKEKIDAGVSNKVDKVEGSSLATTAQLTQIETNKTDISGLKTSKADASALENKVDKVSGKELVSTTDITQITTNKTDIASIKSTYATKEELANLGDLKGACKKSELEGKKASSKANDMYIVTDDSNHIYYYTGTEFVDTSAVAHVDLSNYYDKGTIDSSLSNKVDKVSGKDLVSTSDITQITTNKNNISSLQTSLSTIESDLSTLATALTEMV